MANIILQDIKKYLDERNMIFLEEKNIINKFGKEMYDRYCNESFTMFSNNAFSKKYNLLYKKIGRLVSSMSKCDNKQGNKYKNLEKECNDLKLKWREEAKKCRLDSRTKQAKLYIRYFVKNG